ncbi:Crp/Fnr family transcriptional regulator [uncultured Aquimarina sp.]|uniref:Crp/Fnr family transcriptional regulator n=1 Tax=uncultured Aquimarina sp. TaxID=575652 RepID=UPI00260BA1E0|nr:Crp/Fnr family transcriptional regulator [uncultured Aquimarina sp.]
MEDILAERLEKIKLKNKEAFIAFNEAFKSNSAKKDTILEHPNSVCKYLYILSSGITKQFRDKEDGTEHIIWFNFKGDLVTSFKSFVEQTSTNEGVKVIADCEFLMVSREKCYHLAEKYHEVETFFREMLEIYLIQSEERMFFLQALTAKEKYTYLQKNMPHFIQKLPQKELAKFLGITRETLSRIRKYS